MSFAALLWRRIAAFWVDALIVVGAAYLFGFLFFDWTAGLAIGGVLLGYGATLAYFMLSDSRVCGGQSLGRRLFGIAVTGRDGAPLSLIRALPRALIALLPYMIAPRLDDLLKPLWSDTYPEPVGIPAIVAGCALICLVAGGLVGWPYMILCNRKTRQGLHDVLLRSVVVPVLRPQCSEAPGLPYMHLVCAVVLSVPIAAYIFGSHVTRDDLYPDFRPPMAALERALEARPEILAAHAIELAARMGPDRDRFEDVNVDVRVRDADGGLSGEIEEVIEWVAEDFAEHGQGGHLGIRVRHGFDLGVARWTESHCVDNERAPVACPTIFWGVIF